MYFIFYHIAAGTFVKEDTISLLAKTVRPAEFFG
jgi:hypothetical protein